MTEKVQEPSTIVAALLGRCPRCGKGKLFAGFLTVASRCTACGLEYKDFDAGDGPSVFAILIVGFLVAGGALILEATESPPYWVHAVIWLPAIIILAPTMLRWMKGLLLVLQYKHQAHEGRRAD